MRRATILICSLWLAASCASSRQPSASVPAEPTATAPSAASSLHAQLAAADEALRRGDLDRAHELYSQLLHRGDLPRDILLGVARGLYQTADFQGSLAAFARLGVLHPGEEQYHYYAAVALFETGSFVAAKKQLTCALPYIQLTNEVERYRAKIESIRD